MTNSRNTANNNYKTRLQFEELLYMRVYWKREEARDVVMWYSYIHGDSFKINEMNEWMLSSHHLVPARISIASECICHIKSCAISASCRSTLNLVGTITYHIHVIPSIALPKPSRCRSFLCVIITSTIIKIKSMWANCLFGNISVKCQKILSHSKFKLVRFSLSFFWPFSMLRFDGLDFLPCVPVLQKRKSGP